MINQNLNNSLDSIPKHIAIIMDGNGRWAKKRGLPRIFGHREGSKSVREIVTVCGELKVKALTLYAFSTENWSRPKKEIDALMSLLVTMLKKEVKDLNQKNVRLQAIGRIHELSEKVQRELKNAIHSLRLNQGLILNLALNYGGRQEIVDAVNQLIKEGCQKIDEKILSEYLYTKDLPDPDLVIRTSGEQRISNFLLYQIAYAEFYSTSVLWPDFRRDHLLFAIQEFQKRERRFGGTNSIFIQKSQSAMSHS